MGGGGEVLARLGGVGCEYDQSMLDEILKKFSKRLKNKYFGLGIMLRWLIAQAVWTKL